MLRIDGINVFYGLLQILFDLSLSVGDGEIVSLIGTNGAGKTTTLRTVSGILTPAKGSIRFLDQRIDGMEPHAVSKMGITHVPEGREIFPSLKVIDNLELGAIHREARLRRSDNLQIVFQLFPRLEERTNQLAGTLSGGEQQMLAIGRGIMALPKLLILDEPSLGLAPLVVSSIFEAVKEVNSRGTPIFLVEQNVVKTLSISNKAYVLESGHLVMEGKGEDLLRNPYIKNAYLGI